VDANLLLVIKTMGEEVVDNARDLKLSTKGLTSFHFYSSWIACRSCRVFVSRTTWPLKRIINSTSWYFRRNCFSEESLVFEKCVFGNPRSVLEINVKRV